MNSNSWHGFPLEQAIAGTVAAGFHHIELTATIGWTEHVFPTMSFRDLWNTKDALAAAGLSVIGLSGHTNVMDTARIPDFLANIRLAAFFGAKFIVTSIGEAHIKDAAVASDAQVAENIAGLLPYVTDHGLTLALENHGEHGTGRRLKNIVDLIDSPSVVINYDTANAIFYGPVDVAEDLAVALPRVGYVHLKDKAGDWNEWNFPAPGLGYVDFPEILSQFVQAENDAPFSVEIEFTAAGPADLAEVDAAAVQAAKYLTTLGLAL
jgi:sugar phosphate isomerase/epimerase